MIILEILQSLGFNKNEARVYLAVLELGESTVLPIAKKSGIKRTYCYDILSSLALKGAVFYIEKRGRRRFFAVEPKMMQKIYENKVKKFQSIVPELQNIYQKVSTRPQTRYLEGELGIEIIFHEILREAKEVWSITSVADWMEAFPDYVRHVRALVDAKIKVQDLAKYSKESLEYAKLYNGLHQEVRFLPKTSAYTTDFITWNNKLVLISYGTDIYTVAVESEQIANSMKELHKLLWNSAKVVKKQ